MHVPDKTDINIRHGLSPANSHLSAGCGCRWSGERAPQRWRGGVKDSHRTQAENHLDGAQHRRGVIERRVSGTASSHGGDKKSRGAKRLNFGRCGASHKNGHPGPELRTRTGLDDVAEGGIRVWRSYRSETQDQESRHGAAALELFQILQKYLCAIDIRRTRSITRVRYRCQSPIPGDRISVVAHG